MESIKKSFIGILAILSIVLLSGSAFADVPYFHSISPNEYDFNATSGFSQFTYDIGQDGVGLTTATNTLYLNDSGTPVFIESNQFTGLSPRDLVDDNFTFTYNGDHYVEIELVYEDNTSENLTINLALSSFSNGVDYVAPAVEEELTLGAVPSLVVNIFDILDIITLGVVSLLLENILVLIIVVVFSGLIISMFLIVLDSVSDTFRENNKKLK